MWKHILIVCLGVSSVVAMQNKQLTGVELAQQLQEFMKETDRHKFLLLWYRDPSNARSTVPVKQEHIARCEEVLREFRTKLKAELLEEDLVSIEKIYAAFYSAHPFPTPVPEPEQNNKYDPHYTNACEAFAMLLSFRYDKYHKLNVDLHNALKSSSRMQPLLFYMLKFEEEKDIYKRRAQKAIREIKELRSKMDPLHWQRVERALTDYSNHFALFCCGGTLF